MANGSPLSADRQVGVLIGDAGLDPGAVPDAPPAKILDEHRPILP